MKSLVLAEKPSVARDIARVLHCSKKLNGAIEGEKYIITWGLGHLVTLADPEGYDVKYKEWNMETLPIMPEKMKLEVINQTSKQYNAVKTQLYRNDVNEIIIATDAGREGELVARLILEKAGSKKIIKRLWISSVTDKAIKEGFLNIKNGHEYDNLYDAAMSRAEADWLVGINATRALTCKYNASLSCGRVQTPTIAMIAKREEEIKQFVGKPFYGIMAKLAESKLSFAWHDEKTNSFSSFDKERMQEIIKKLSKDKNIEGKIIEIKKTPKKVFSQRLYDLTELQRDANKKFNFSAKETLNIMQRLYENAKVLTYPRTDSRYITTDVVDTLKERLRACSVGPYKKYAARLINQTIVAKPSFVDNSKVTDHHAIIPTEQFVQLDHMTIEERKIYDLVVRRFIAVLYPAYEYEQTILKLKIGEEVFTAKGKTVIKQGFKEVYENNLDEENDSELKEQELPKIENNYIFKDIKITMTEGKTKPPAYFNEATLLSAMENPAQYMELSNSKEAKTLGETGGLGTVATRADIIEKLFNNFLLEKKGKEIYTTKKAKQLLEIVPEELKKPELTAKWEMQLLQIANGKLKREEFMKNIRNYSRELISEIKTDDGKFRHDNITNHKCPDCGKYLLLVKGKNSEMLVCQDRNCGYRETISRTSNARCPKCHKKLTLKGKGEKQIFVCSCGYKEKLDAFKERRNKEGAGVSKKDVNKYLNKQKKEIEVPINNIFSEALSKIKID